MFNMFMRHEPSGVFGNIDSTTVGPDGQAMARIQDHWFFVSDLLAIGE